ncbi:hypothetical protein ACFRAQ_34920 [Nocardia sp. NPDC056611]|uniref:hypothetical protein n=1 Tax=Nocardia sp. NPDC056611 TaxID=3345877 RepID=UPI00366B0257
MSNAVLVRDGVPVMDGGRVDWRKPVDLRKFMVVQCEVTPQGEVRIFEHPLPKCQALNLFARDKRTLLRSARRFGGLVGLLDNGLLVNQKGAPRPWSQWVHLVVA